VQPVVISEVRLCVGVVENCNRIDKKFLCHVCHLSSDFGFHHVLWRLTVAYYVKPNKASLSVSLNKSKAATTYHIVLSVQCVHQ